MTSTNHFREKILASKDRTLQPVSFPEWEGCAEGLFVRTLTIAEEEEFSRFKNENPDAGHAALLQRFILVVVNAEGEPIFTRADLPFLREKNAAPIQRALEAANGLRDMQAPDLGELRKNSKRGRKGASSSGSAATSAA